jgi:H+-transporting ATPase
MSEKKRETSITKIETEKSRLMETTPTSNKVKITESEETHVNAGDVIDEELEKLIQTDPSQGLSTALVAERLELFGYNGNFITFLISRCTQFLIEIQEKKKHPLVKLLYWFTGPISYLLEIACVVAGALEDWPDFGILLFVLILNAAIGFHEEMKAENCLDALKKTLALKCKALREGQLLEIDSKDLVPGDVIALRLGDIVPADCK